MNYKRPESVLVIVATEAKQVLCLLRSDVKDFWQSVTGSLLEQETPQAAAERELYEETGLQISQGNLIDCKHSGFFTIFPHWRHRYAPGVTENLEHVFLFIVPDVLSIQLSQEHQKYCWLEKDEAIEKMASPSNQAAIKSFI